jgi:hypothetical protein
MIWLPLWASADTIILKSGKRVEVDMAWEENDRVKATLSGVHITYPKNEVERIEKSRKDAHTGQKRGFRFDVWHSGMNLETVQSVAQENNITLQGDETKVQSTAPNKSAENKDSPSGIKMEYSEDILGKPAHIELLFTPVSRTLYRLSIRWPDLKESTDSEFYKKVISSLMNGYGKPAQNQSTVFETVYKWNINKNTTVELIWGKQIFVINFSDTAIE